MADQVKTNTHLLGQMKQELEEGVGELRNNIKQLENCMDELHATWEGPNKKVFEKTHRDMMEFLLKSIKALEVYAESLEIAQKEYNACNSEVQSYVGKII